MTSLRLIPIELDCHVVSPPSLERAHKSRDHLWGRNELAVLSVQPVSREQAQLNCTASPSVTADTCARQLSTRAPRSGADDKILCSPSDAAVRSSVATGRPTSGSAYARWAEMAYQFRVGNADDSEPWMEQWVKDFCHDPSLRQQSLRTRKMADEPRHPTKELVLPGTGKVVHIDEKLLSGIQRLNELGITTQFCCQGGGPGYNIAYLVLEAGKDFPPELLQAWQGAGFDANPSRVYAKPLVEPMPASTDCFYRSDGSRRKRSGMRFPPELLNAWHCTGYKAPASEAYAWLQHGQEQELADNFCRSLDDWVQGKLDLSGASYRVVSALCTSSRPANPANRR